jgi:hypothetical protein
LFYGAFRNWRRTAFNSGIVDKYDGLKKIKGNGSGCVTAFCRHIPRETE